MAGEGMVAVVQGLRDCGLAVTLLDDDGKTYTLVPNGAIEKKMAGTPMCDTGAQATDGHYASIYKVHHCKLTPTSPPAVLPEFPPQRAEVCRGQGNFEVGGPGSGESGFVPTRSSCYRGAMCWADRGSVCSPRPSRDPDAFANSLRKYPSPERSSELMERLITYSQANNYKNPPPRHHSPPCRACDHVSTHTVCLDRSARSSRQRMYEPEVNVVKRQKAPEESPTRDRRCYDAESYRKPTFCKNSDVRIVRDISKRFKESIKSMSCYPYTQPVCADARDRYERPTPESCHSNYVNTEIQVTVLTDISVVGGEPVLRTYPSLASKSCCFDGITEGRDCTHASSSKTHSVPLSPVSSVSTPPEQALKLPADSSITRSVQTINKAFTKKSVETTTSSIDIPRGVKVVTRKSKSFSDFAIDMGVKNDIVEWLDDARNAKVKALQDVVLKKLNNRFKKISLSKSERLKVRTGCSKYHDKENKSIKDRLINELHRMHLHCYNICKSADMLRTEANPYATAIEQSGFEDAIKEWINDIPIKKRDFLLRPVMIDQIYNTIVKRLKHLAIKKIACNREQSLKAEILNILEEIPIEFHGYSKRIYLNTLADALMSKLENVLEEHEETKHLRTKTLDRSISYAPRNCLQPTEKELKRLVVNTLINFSNKTNAKIKPDCVEEIEMDLIDILMDSINAERLCNDNFAKEEIAILLNNVTKLPENEAIELAMQLSENLKEILSDKQQNVKSRPEIVLTIQNTSKLNIEDTCANRAKKMTAKTDEIKDSELNKYMLQLSEKIEEWLSNLQITQAHDNEFKQAVVNDLASDIIDRHKYLELNNSRGSDADELEHLKYQIFKWINKLTGEDSTEAIDHAADLMKRIRNISVPMLSAPPDQPGKFNCDKCHRSSESEIKTSVLNGNFVDSKYKNDLRNQSNISYITTDHKAQTVMTAKTKGQGLHISQEPGPSGYVPPRPCSPEGPACQLNASGNNSKPLMSSLRPPCCSGPQNTGTPSMKQLNEDFEEFLKKWVYEIPIQANTPEEAALAEKARLGIYHGIWKAITKIKFEPATFHNKFFYEDVLEQEIDDLLDLLPQTQEMLDNRHLLKVKLIEKTTEANDLIKTVASPASYKQQLAQQIAANLPRRKVNTDEDDPEQLYEEMLILCIAEDFILTTKYKNEDMVKANAYRNKVVRRIEAILKEIKRTHGKNIRDLNTELCINDIFSALHKVPLPSEDTIREEADEILLGIEIDQWFTDLPIVKNDEHTEQLHRRRLKDALAKKLHEMEKEINIADCTGEPKFKHEISLFLEKVPLEKDESLNINFMVDELTNRMKNRERVTGGRRKSVAFQDGQSNYNRGLQGRSDIPADLCQQSNQGRIDAPDQGRFGHRSSLSWSDSCSQPKDENAEYHEFSRERPACSSMINPQQGPQQYDNEPPPDFRQWGLDSQPSEKWYSFDGVGNPNQSKSRAKDPHFAYVPGQFHEENLGGGFGYTLHGDMPMSSQRYAYPDLVDSPNLIRQGPPVGTYFDSQGNVKPSPSPANGQYQPTPAMEVPIFNDQAGGMRNANGRARQSMNSALGGSVYGHQAGAMPQTYPGRSQMVNPAPAPAFDQPMDMSSFRRFSSEKPPCSSWIEPSGQFESLLYDGNGPSPEEYALQTRAPSPQREYFDPYVHLPEQAQGGRFSLNNIQTFQGPCKNCSQRAFSPSRCEQPSISPERQEIPGSLEEGFIRSRSGITQNHSQQGQPSVHVSQRRHSPPPIQDNVANASQAGRGQRGLPAPDFHRSTDPEGIQKVIEHNRSENAQFLPAPQDGQQNRSMPRTSLSRDAPPAPFHSPRQDEDHGYLAPNPPPTGLSISDQPVGFSTPNQRTSNARPPNIKVRHQIARDRVSERVDSGTDDDGEEVRIRCHCVERFKRSKKKRGPHFNCHDCLDGVFPYYFPMGCPYPYFFDARRP